MSAQFPTQKFQFGDRVRTLKGAALFVIDAVRVRGKCFEYSSVGWNWYPTHDLTLSPERPPYVASERGVVGRAVTIARYQPELYRCETDAELAARHAVERDAYDAQGDEA